MFDKILIANRGDHQRAALMAAKPERMLRVAQAGDRDAVTGHV